MEELVQVVKDFFSEEEFEFHIEDLRNPTPRSVVNFFNRVLIEFAVDFENLAKPQIGQVVSHDLDILPQLNVLSALRTTFQFLDIGLFDLLNPNQKQNFELVRQVMSFLEFCESTTAQSYDEKTNPHREVKSQTKHLLQEIEYLVQEKNHKAIELERAKTEREEVDGIFKEKKVELQEMLKEKSALAIKVDEIKSIKIAKEKQLTALIEEIEKVNGEIIALHQEVVDRSGNPEVNSNDIDLLIKEKEEAEKRKKDVWENMKAKTTMRSQLEKLVKCIESANEELQQMVQLFNSFSKLQSEKGILEQKLKNFPETQKNLTKKTSEIIETISKEEGSIDTLKLRFETEFEDKKIEIAELKREYEDKEIEKGNLAHKIKNYNDKNENLLREYENMVAVAKKAQESILTQCDSDMVNLLEELENLKVGNSKF